MRYLKKIKLFFQMDNNIKLLYMEAFVLLGWARVMKSIAFSRIVPYLGEYMKETSFKNDESKMFLIKNVSMAVNIMSRNTFWESMCLVKAIAAMKMLERRDIDSTLYLGTAKDQSGNLIAHAWLRSGPYYLTGQEVKDKFVVVSKFAKSTMIEDIEGENNDRKFKS